MAIKDSCGNRVDDNCDGQTDEGCECVPGDPARVLCGNSDGRCRAVMVCGSEGLYNACVVEIGPANDDANNCGACANRCFFANGDAACVDSTCRLGECWAGHADLDGDDRNGCEYRCPQMPVGPELCGNRLDDNCDGRTDEGCDCDPGELTPIPCGNNEGRCRATMVCDADGRLGECHVAVGPSPTDVDNCGVCGRRCSFSNGATHCLEGRCVLTACEPGYANQDSNPDNGCEYKCPVSSPVAEVCGNRMDDNCDGKTDENCECNPLDTRKVLCGNNTGICRASMSCDATGRFTQCVTEVGGRVFEMACDGHDDDCDGAVDEDFDRQRDPENCGACGRRCVFPNGVGRCADGVCVLAGCGSGYVDLDRESANGCEYSCATPASAVETCGNHLDDNCDGRTDEECSCDPADPRKVECGNNTGGCRANMTCGPDGRYRQCQVELGPSLVDPANCGACGRRCSSANAASSCVSGVCVMGACATGHVDLDANPDNGCEYRCPVVPPTPVEVCGNRIDDNCDGRSDEGCECDPADRRKTQCGNNVGTCRAIMVCGADGRYGACEVEVPPAPAEACDAHDDDCDGRIDNGFDLETDPRNCGACGRRCVFPNAGARCARRECSLGDCAPDHANLNGLADDGCEYRCPVSPPDSSEICGNLLDDNCDGRVDENCAVLDAGADVPPPVDLAPPRSMAPPTSRLEVQSISPDLGSRAETLTCGRQEGLNMAFRVACRPSPQGQFPFAQCVVEPAASGTFDMDAFDADNGGRGLLQVRFCLRSLDGGPITGGFNLWYGDYPRRKVLKLVTDNERQGIAPGCYVRTFSPDDADCSRFLRNTPEIIVQQQVPSACRFETAAEADTWKFNGKWTSLGVGAECAFSYRNTRLWITAESCSRDVHAQIYRVGVVYYPDALACNAAGSCNYSDRTKCAPASDAPMCSAGNFYCAGTCEADCEGAGNDCQVQTSEGELCMSKIECVNGVAVCPLIGCASP